MRLAGHASRFPPTEIGGHWLRAPYGSVTHECTTRTDSLRKSATRSM